MAPCVFRDVCRGCVCVCNAPSADSGGLNKCLKNITRAQPTSSRMAILEVAMRLFSRSWPGGEKIIFNDLYQILVLSDGKGDGDYHATLDYQSCRCCVC